MSLKKVAIVQHPSVHLNLKQSIEKLSDLVQESVKEKPDLIAFGECWLSGYPAWLDYCPNIGNWDSDAMKEVYLKFRQNSLAIESPEMEVIKKLAKIHKTSIVIGINEKVDKGIGNGTIYNSILTISENGDLLNHHRKLMPTFTEKLLYGIGDGSGLNSVQTSAGRVSAAICWEHWMPLTRQALHNAGEDIHVAVWPKVHDKHQLASKHYAFEGRCFVLAAGQIMYAKDFPSELEVPDKLKDNPNQMILNGGSCVIGPNGDFITQPIFDLETIIYAEINLEDVVKESMTLDVSGHYQRNDIFTFLVNQKRID